ncbi:MAG: response regulator [Sutterellaceae bacterium]|nr:response regulator [Sutterellaceae bacterium]MDD7441793.1 response regulator [Sutterellaceae bacterium]MDY2868518.1 response regulator [Mesosutterella sp.]
MTQDTNDNPLVRLIDDDELFLTSQKMLLETRGFEVAAYTSAKEFLEGDTFTRPGCIVTDVRMPGLTGLDLQKILETRRLALPLIFLTGHGDVSMAVHTMRHGAADFLEKPVPPRVLVAAVEKAVAASLAAAREAGERKQKLGLYDTLTPREREVVALAALDTPNKVIAARLGISEPTVKMHRANAFAKLEVKSVLEAYRLLTSMGIELEGDHQ